MVSVAMLKATVIVVIIMAAVETEGGGKGTVMTVAR